MRHFIRPLAIALLLLPTLTRAQSTTTATARTEEKSWSSFLPIWAEEAEKRGYQIPLPFGISVNAMGLSEPHVVQDLRLGPIPEAPRSVPRSLLEVSTVDVNAWSINVRADVWLFPFLNLYGIGGRTGGKADLGLTVLPGFLGLQQEIQIPTIRYEGETYGGGGLLVGGYKNVFVLVDCNYTETDLDLLDSDVETLVIDWRIGWRQRFGQIHGSFWTGAMYQKASQTMTGVVSLSPEDPPLRFEVDQVTDKPWNVLIGTQWEFGRQWWALLEAGIGDRKQLLGSVSYRF